MEIRVAAGLMPDGDRRYETYSPESKYGKNAAICMKSAQPDLLKEGKSESVG